MQPQEFLPEPLRSNGFLISRWLCRRRLHQRPPSEALELLAPRLDGAVSYRMRWFSRLKPRWSTVLLFVVMTLLWIPIYADLLDSLGDTAEEIVIPVLLAAYVGLAGVYGAIAALSESPAARTSKFLFLVFLRTVLLTGAAALLASVFE